MTWEVLSTVFIAEVNMLNKSILVTVVRCFFYRLRTNIFFAPIIININYDVLWIVVFAIAEQQCLFCFFDVPQKEAWTTTVMQEEELRRRTLPSYSSSMLPLQFF